MIVDDNAGQQDRLQQQRKRQYAENDGDEERDEDNYNREDNRSYRARENPNPRNQQESYSRNRNSQKSQMRFGDDDSYQPHDIRAQLGSLVDIEFPEEPEEEHVGKRRKNKDDIQKQQRSGYPPLCECKVSTKSRYIFSREAILLNPVNQEEGRETYYSCLGDMEQLHNSYYNNGKYGSTNIPFPGKKSIRVMTSTTKFYMMRDAEELAKQLDTAKVRSYVESSIESSGNAFWLPAIADLAWKEDKSSTCQKMLSVCDDRFFIDQFKVPRSSSTSFHKIRILAEKLQRVLAPSSEDSMKYMSVLYSPTGLYSENCRPSPWFCKTMGLNTDTNTEEVGVKYDFITLARTLVLAKLYKIIVKMVANNKSKFASEFSGDEVVSMIYQQDVLLKLLNTVTIIDDDAECGPEEEAPDLSYLFSNVPTHVGNKRVNFGANSRTLHTQHAIDTNDCEVISDSEVNKAGDASHGIGDASQGIGDASQGVGDASQGVGGASHGIGDASQGVGDASQGVGDASQGIGDASQGVGDANQEESGMIQVEISDPNMAGVLVRQNKSILRNKTTPSPKKPTNRKH
jgi:hypothetical protein